MAMTRVITQQGAENMAYVRALLHRKQPGFSAALQWALMMAERELASPDMPCDTARLADAPRQGGFARDFATANGPRVMVSALNHQQFADLARTTGLTSTFAFLERLLQADFSTCGDLDANRAIIAKLLAPWFARRTVAQLAIAFAGTSVPWAILHGMAGRPGARP
jgi:crotonobetainyl-CoA:carnitine CoA-transferase CaiB-like acyl-CoA transferase